jgi:hypothetical protein
MAEERLRHFRKTVILGRLDPPGAPATIYHYTTWRGLEGIVETDRFWMSNVLCLNDRSELVYGLEIVKEVANTLPKYPSCLTGLRLDKEHWRSVIGETTFVASFSSDEDKLSQWREYADKGQGFAVGFNRQALMNAKCPVFPVLYERVEQCALVRGTLQFAENLLSANSFEAPEESFKCGVLANLLACMVQFKHPSFREEDEWRGLWMEPDRVRFRKAGSVIVPYFELPEARKFMRAVVVGPCLELPTGVLRLFLDQAGLSAVTIGESCIPLGA